MGAPLPPNAFMPMHWALKAEMRVLPGDPGIEWEVSYWIEELGAWIAEDEEEAEAIREAFGPEAKVMKAEDLR